MDNVVSDISRFIARTRARCRAIPFYRRFVQPGALCFDIGANVGERARYFLALQARVVAVEPQPDCVARLHELAATYPELTVEPVALGRAQGSAELQLATASTIASLSPGWIDSVRESGRFAEHDWTQAITVAVTTLDTLIERHGLPEFTKIDVEGYESEVVAGLSQPLPLLSFEFTSEWWESAAAVVEWLDNLGMRQFNISPGESFRFTWDGWRSAGDVISYFRDLPPGELVWGDVYVATGSS
jgi:FkbM family methyltransferase